MPFKRRRKHQRILWPGVSFVLVALFVIVAAVNTGANLLYLVGGGLLSFLILSVMLSRWTLRKLTFSREAPYSVHRGEPLTVTVRLENRKALMSVSSLALEEADRPGESVGYVFRIPARRIAVIRTTHVFERRGVFMLPDLMAISGFPFGLIEARVRLKDERGIIVYPKVYPVRASALDRLAGSGDTRRQIGAEGDEFHSLRDYIRGDDTRRIAWRSSARRGSLLVREMESESTRLVFLCVDTRKTDHEDFEERFEEAMDVAASLADALLARRFAVGLMTPTVFLAEAEGVGQARRILETLARLNPSEEAGGQFPPALSSRQGAAQLLISPDPARWGLRSGPAGTRVVDPREVLNA